MPQSLAALYCHIIFSTKNRVPEIDPIWQDRLYSYIGGTLRSHQCVLMAAGGVADHVHLLVSLSRTITVADAVRDIKANSSRWIHENFPDHKTFAWQSGYGAFSVSHSHLDQVRAYLAKQAEHHRSKTFQEEFRAFLAKYEIEYDERYAWD
jgi:REP element-mobilizing transposase RayT